MARQGTARQGKARFKAWLHKPQPAQQLQICLPGNAEARFKGSVRLKKEKTRWYSSYLLLCVLEAKVPPSVSY